VVVNCAFQLCVAARLIGQALSSVRSDADSGIGDYVAKPEWMRRRTVDGQAQVTRGFSRRGVGRRRVNPLLGLSLQKAVLSLIIC